MSVFSVACPCRRFQPIQNIAKAIIVDQPDGEQEEDQKDATGSTRVETLISWILQTKHLENEPVASHHESIRNDATYYCSFPCPNRGQASLAILNAIRDACRLYLDDEDDLHSKSKDESVAANSASTGTEKRMQGKNYPSHPKTYNNKNNSGGNSSNYLQSASRQNYDSSFPKLGGRQNNNNQKQTQAQNHSANHRQQQQHAKNPANKNNKRRIRPATIQALPNNRNQPHNAPVTGTSSNAWGHISPNPAFSSATPTQQEATANDSVLNRKTNKNLQLLEERFEKPAATSSTVSSLESQKPSDLTEATAESSKSFGNEEDNQQSPPQEHPPITKDISSFPSLRNLVDVYDTLIQASLVPSTALELNLMLRLVAISPRTIRKESEKGTTSSSDSTSVFDPLFPDSESCIIFASQILLHQAHFLFGFGFTESILSNCPPIRIHCPKLLEKLSELEQDRKKQQQGERNGAISSNRPRVRSTVNQTALFTLPFDPTRDSKHNFRSAEEQALFKNRESIRDAFLYQLRNFYQTKSSSNHLAAHHPQSQPSRPATQPQPREMVRVVMDTIQSDNFSWFANVFRDLLLQLGPVPVVQETDEELLQIADSDTLQKLHQRLFGASSTQHKKPSNRSSQSLSDSSSSRKGSSSHQTTAGDTRRKPNPAFRKSEPQHSMSSTSSSSPNSARTSLDEEQLCHFPGHQEFFFIFVRTADSYVLNQHLLTSFTQSLINNIENLNSDFQNSLDELDRHLHRLRLLAKFIGVLLFSPFWSPSVGTVPSQDALFHRDILGWLSFWRISLCKVLENAKEQHALVAMIPWMVDLLKMAQWIPHPTILITNDPSSTYPAVLRKLRALQLWLDNGGNTSISGVNRVFILACLENLFRENVGLAQTIALEERNDEILTAKQYQQNNNETESSVGISNMGLDCWDDIVTKEMMLAADRSIEDLFDLTVFLSSRHKTPGASRKLRPLQLDSKNFSAKPLSSSAASTAAHDKKEPAIATGTMESSHPSQKHRPMIIRNLRDMFFHQQQRIKSICDFTLTETLKELPILLAKECVKPIIDTKIQDFNFSEPLDASATKTELFASCNTFVESLVAERTKETLKVLGPASCKAEVRQMACQFTAEEGCERALMLIHSAVDSGINTLTNEYRKAAKQPKTIAKGQNSSTNQNECEQSTQNTNDKEEFEALERICSQLELLTKRLKDGRDESDSTIESLVQILGSLDLFIQFETSEIPPQSLLRRVYKSIVEFDFQLQPKLATWLEGGNNEQQQWQVFWHLFRLACQLTHISRYGLPSLVKVITDSQRFSELMSLADSCGDTVGFLKSLVHLIKARIVSCSTVTENLPDPEVHHQMIALGQGIAPKIEWQRLFERSIFNNQAAAK